MIVRTEKDIRKRLDWLRDRTNHHVMPSINSLDGGHQNEDYTALTSEMYTLEWILGEGGVEVVY